VGLFVIKTAAPPPSRKLTHEAMSFSLVDLSVPLKYWAKLTGDSLKVAFVLRIPGTAFVVSLRVILDDGGVDQKRRKGELVRGVIIFQQRCCIVIAVLCVRI